MIKSTNYNHYQILDRLTNKVLSTVESSKGEDGVWGALRTLYFNALGSHAKKQYFKALQAFNQGHAIIKPLKPLANVIRDNNDDRGECDAPESRS